MKTLQANDQTLMVDVSDLHLGQVVKIKSKHRPRNRSPYCVIGGKAVDGETLVTPIDAPGNGNRKQRRAKWRVQQQTRKRA